jgi:hypothetical protein
VVKVLDLFSGAGGAGHGYELAGATVVAWDIRPQPRSPHEFNQGDALEVMRDTGYLRQFDLIHASPPCKTNTSIRHTIWPGASRTDPINLIPPTRELLDASGVPYVIENVPGAAMIDPIVLCGSMFRLGVRRHRLFELGRWKTEQPLCRHAEQKAASPAYPVLRYHSGSPIITMSPVIGVYGHGQGLGPGEVDLWRQAMGISWMVREELSQAIPPVYTKWIAERFMR